MIPVSLWASFDSRHSLVKAAFLVLGLVTFYGTVRHADSRESLTRLVALYVALGSSVALLGLMGTNWRAKIPVLMAIASSLPQAIRGLPGAPQGFDPNEVAGVVLWFLPLQIALLSWLCKRGCAWTPKGVALGCSTLLETAVLILTQSRGAWLSLACGLLLIGALVDRRVRVASILLCGSLLAAAAVRGPHAVASVLGAGAAERVIGELVWTDRIQIWRVAIQAIRDFPFTGMGLGTFRRVSRVLYALDVWPSYDIAHAHNGFLQAGVDFGLLGLVAYGAIWFLAGRLALSSFQRGQGTLRALALGLGGCVASSLMYNLTDTIALGARPGPAWWMMLGLAVATARLAGSALDREAQ